MERVRPENRLRTGNVATGAYDKGALADESNRRKQIRFVAPSPILVTSTTTFVPLFPLMPVKGFPVLTISLRAIPADFVDNGTTIYVIIPPMVRIFTIDSNFRKIRWLGVISVPYDVVRINIEEACDNLSIEARLAKPLANTETTTDIASKVAVAVRGSV